MNRSLFHVLFCWLNWWDLGVQDPSPYFALAKISTCIRIMQWKEIWPYMSLGTQPILLKLCCGNDWQCIVSFHLLLCMIKPFHVGTSPRFSHSLLIDANADQETMISVLYQLFSPGLMSLHCGLLVMLRHLFSWKKIYTKSIVRSKWLILLM